MPPINTMVRQATHVRSPCPAGDPLEFASHLARRHALPGDLLANAAANNPGQGKKLRDLWELTELSANDFADEVAGFYKLRRLNLPQLVAASSLAARFSRRFLREATAFPCQLESDDNDLLVVADPT